MCNERIFYAHDVNIQPQWLNYSNKEGCNIDTKIMNSAINGQRVTENTKNFEFNVEKTQMLLSCFSWGEIMVSNITLVVGWENI